MNKKEAVERWNDPHFLASMEPTLERVLAMGAPVEDLNLAGIHLETDSRIGAYSICLYQREITGSDFSFSTFQCPFFGSTITSTSFQGCTFHATNFHKVKVYRSSFAGALFKGGQGNDSAFEDCDFSGATLKTKPENRLPTFLLRSRFSRCDFTGATLKESQVRASTFEDCIFTGARFLGCDFRGVKFLGSKPDDDQFDKKCSL